MMNAAHLHRRHPAHVRERRAAADRRRQHVRRHPARAVGARSRRPTSSTASGSIRTAFSSSTPDSLGLIDTGYGGKAPPKFRQRHALDDGAPLARNLAAIGVAPDEIDWVILTHLHFDHAGGATYRDEDGHLRPTFPRARHFVQRAEWEDAIGNLPELAGAYYPDDFVPLEKAGLLELIDGDAEIAPASPRNSLADTRAVIKSCASNQPTTRPSASPTCVPRLLTCRHSGRWPTTSFRSTVRRKKPIILNDIVDNHRIALFSHDPDIAAARLSRDSDNEWSAAPA